LSIQSVPGSNVDARVKKVIKLEPNNSDHLSALCGPFDKNLRQIESRLDVKIKNRGHEFEIQGDQKTVGACLELLKQLYREVINGGELSPETLHLFLQESGIEASTEGQDPAVQLIKTRKKAIKPRGEKQNG